MIIAMAQDIRVILVKLADRTHNMRTLEHMSEEKQQRIAQETLDIYAPLGQPARHQLDQESSWRTSPSGTCAERLRRARRKAEPAPARARALHRRRCRAHREQAAGARARSAGCRGASSTSTASTRRCGRQGIDVRADSTTSSPFASSCPAVPNCYEALGMIHQLWKPVPGRFKDFIAIPKPNMYQSLHTTVIGPFGERVEMQIRTEEMHRIAEEGIAAHWALQGGRRAWCLGKDDEKFAWLRQLMEWQQDLKDPKEFLDTVKVDLFTDEVFVFTPKGDVRSLPRGATPVDFAYAIHSDVGSRCVGAKVNGKIVPLRYKLKNGDTVEVLTSPNAHPSKDWLTFVKTSRAQQRIRALHQAAAAGEEPAARPRAPGQGVPALRSELRQAVQGRRVEGPGRGARVPRRGRPVGGARLRQGDAPAAARRSCFPPSGWPREPSAPQRSMALRPPPSPPRPRAASAG